MADELISREAVLKKLSRMIDYCKTDNKVTGLTALFQVADAIMDCPSVDAERPKGEWEEYWDDVYLMYFHRCSECKADAPAKQGTMMDKILTHFCPHCGADMRGE